MVLKNSLFITAEIESSMHIKQISMIMKISQNLSETETTAKLLAFLEMGFASWGLVWAVLSPLLVD